MTDIIQLPGKDAKSLLQYRRIIIPADQLYLPGVNYANRVMVDNNRPPTVLRNMQTLYNTRRLGGTNYLSILPVGQDVEHLTSASSAASPLCFDPKNIVELAIETGRDCAASIYSVPASVSRRYMYCILSLVEFNHNEILSYPTEYGQALYVSVEQAFNMGAVATETMIYFGSEQLRRRIEEIFVTFERTYELDLITMLWAYLCNSTSKKDGVNYHVSADLTGQVNHLAATTGTNVVRQRMAENNGGYRAVSLGYTDDRAYSKLTSDNPINSVRYQLANCCMDRAGLVNSGGAAGGETDLAGVVCIAVTNGRAGGIGLIPGRKTFKKSMADSVKLINAVQDVYLGGRVTIA